MSFQVFRLFGGSSRGCFGRLRPVGSSVQCGGHVFERLVARLHVGRDIQLYRGAQGDGYVGQSVGGKHGVQFRCGQEFRLVCHERDARGTVLDACRDWGFCFASSRFYGVYVEASATAYGRGYCAA